MLSDIMQELPNTEISEDDMVNALLYIFDEVFL